MGENSPSASISAILLSNFYYRELLPFKNSKPERLISGVNDIKTRNFEARNFSMKNLMFCFER